MGSVYKRRRGIEWESYLYKRLINYLRSNQMCIDNINISIKDVKKLSVEIFPKHGHRKKYQDNVLDFLQQYSDIITKDVSAEPNNTISAPKLKLWLAYKEKFVSAMINEPFTGFADDVIQKSKSYKNTFDTFVNKQFELRDKITQKAIQFFELKDDESEQLLLLKKLIILSIVTENNPDFNRFMSSVSRISRIIKQRILEALFQDDFKEYHYSLLDLMMPYRCQIREKKRNKSFV
ncbi:hypothetical protein TSAR_004987 [Trichomalopsis sarcophagae]|uniref:Uncharacterized protein n=1 Tax=Trichomalopsis sarcophagae TaxID=543379 RepID=A0A232EH15_9HYME|nr:hypothetical protein TSAR_004987 [Trichomalopsis sarcophagae]